MAGATIRATIQDEACNVWYPLIVESVQSWMDLYPTNDIDPSGSILTGTLVLWPCLWKWHGLKEILYIPKEVAVATRHSMLVVGVLQAFVEHVCEQ
jgi:hypothetical protein